MSRFVLAILLTCCGAAAQNSGLAELRFELEALRPHRQEHRETRGATPELTRVKHHLRDWAEAQLAAFGVTDDEDALNRSIQETLVASGVLCPDGCIQTALGYIDLVRVRREREFLTVQTSVGIACGYDDSEYVYEWRNGTWRKIFETEQDNYTPTGYTPQTIYAVHVSPPDESGSRLVLSIGSKPGCSSAFQPLYYRIWRMAPREAKPRLLLDSSEVTYMGDYPPARGTASSGEVRLEFTRDGTGYGEGHQAVRHFSVRGNIAKQVEPVAPTPRDFVEEWLDAPWKQSAAWSESPALSTWHFKLHRDDGMGDFPDAPVQCSEPDVWQIGIRLHGVDGEMFYLVRWRQPDHFTMSAIADHPLCH